MPSGRRCRSFCAWPWVRRRALPNSQRGLALDADRARANLDLTGGLIVSERLGIVLVPLVGKSRFDSLIADAAAGGDLASLVRALPEAADLDVDALVDPAQYVGLASSLVDEALREASQDGIRP